MTRVGFTGTQVGCTDAQIAALTRTLVELRDDPPLFLRVDPLGADEFVLHHGSCVGADAEAHYVARVMGAAVEKHPPAITSKMARCGMLPGEVTHPAAGYLARNIAIVKATVVLVACPREEVGEERRSGTWHTIRRARALRRPVAIVRPSGRVEWERCNFSVRGT